MSDRGGGVRMPCTGHLLLLHANRVVLARLGEAYRAWLYSVVVLAMQRYKMSDMCERRVCRARGKHSIYAQLISACELQYAGTPAVERDFA